MLQDDRFSRRKEMSVPYGVLFVMIVFGLDASLTSSGFAYTLDDKVCTGRILTNSLRGPERLDFVITSIRNIFRTKQFGKEVLVALEGYAMGVPAKGSRVFDIGELGGVLKHHFWLNGYDVLVVPPTTLKMFVTGNGRAKKPEVMQGIADVWGYKVQQHDEADAFGLMKLGQARVNGRVLRAYDEKRRSAVESCQIVKGLTPDVVAIDCKTG